MVLALGFGTNNVNAQEWGWVERALSNFGLGELSNAAREKGNYSAARFASANVKNHRGENCLFAAFFFDENQNPLKDNDGEYYTVDGVVLLSKEKIYSFQKM